MTKPTITTLGIATTYFLVFAGVLGYAFVTVEAQRSEAMNLRTTLAEQTSKQTVARTIGDLTASTAEVRGELADYFLSERDTISFIAEVEALAGAQSVAIETTTLDIVRPADAAPELKTGFRVEGTRQSVLAFVQALETMPYHSRIPSVQFTQDGNVSGAQVEVLVTLLP